MHGGAVTLARHLLEDPVAPDFLLATDMLDLSLFLRLTRSLTQESRVALYMHENQLTYPLPASSDSGPMRRQGGERDLHYAFINFSSMLSADHIFFNSRFHLECWFDSVGPFLKNFPELNELETIPALRDKSSVLPVGVDLRRLDRFPTHANDNDLTTSRQRSDGPLILWNHRWEYDKNPEAFFTAMMRLDRQSQPFRLAICGQNFSHAPSIFERVRSLLGERIIHFGFAPERQYRKLLHAADITVSTANHDFFGIASVEAIYCRTFPILPRGLNYTSLIPEGSFRECFYGGGEELMSRLRWAFRHVRERRQISERLRSRVSRFDWTRLVPEYDRRLTRLCQTG